MRTKFLLCGCILLLLMVVAMATPCSAVNLIYGCVKSNGNLEIVSGPDQCKSNQTPISWPAGGLTAVSGWIRYDGVPVLGEGFTSTQDPNNGVYYITFDQDFVGDPGCVISLLSSPPPPLLFAQYLASARLYFTSTALPTRSAWTERYIISLIRSVSRSNVLVM